jgi:hypothetical protein
VRLNCHSCCPGEIGIGGVSVWKVAHAPLLVPWPVNGSFVTLAVWVVDCPDCVPTTSWGVVVGGVVVVGVVVGGVVVGGVVVDGVVVVGVVVGVPWSGPVGFVAVVDEPCVLPGLEPAPDANAGPISKTIAETVRPTPRRARRRGNRGLPHP